MNAYTELERELSHIGAAISVLERTRAHLFPRVSVDDPAYWKSRLDAILDARPGDTILERQVAQLCDRLKHLQADSAGVHARGRHHN
ncbi:MAG: hypothetical protein EPN70_11390 [Paraburkholderia sp.]|uniref:hypothetical protein n=1 Tax=Paraburkholderia sp. TaxID=1926495 RepID=UPI0012129E70|nr:hypothetical protein [Paraburkholderia sp.]TAM04403.1 MAG: hypothetical protein EPN70_11390 [Paraburkholderia sp.]TAM32818.1 MAG: hypothetical protein EPN59_00175 [Paraburkholderia sp.]